MFPAEGGRETCGHLGQVNNLEVFEAILFKLFQPRIGIANIFEDACINFGYFSEKKNVFRAWKFDFNNYIVFKILLLISTQRDVLYQNLSLLTPNSRLFHWRLRAPFGFSPQAANRLDRPLGLPCSVNANGAYSHGTMNECVPAEIKWIWPG